MRFLTVLLLCCLCSSVQADQVFVRNKPFTGQVQGKLTNMAEVQIELAPLVEAMGLKLSEVQGNLLVHHQQEKAALPPSAKGSTGKLFVGSHQVPVAMEGPLQMVPLKEFTQAVNAHLNYNAELGTLDINWASSGKKGQWGGEHPGYRVVVFGSIKAPAAKGFIPTLVSFEKKTGVPVIYVDVDKRSSENYIAYIYLYTGTFIPHTVLINEENRPVKRWTGMIAEDKFTKEVRSALR